MEEKGGEGVEEKRFQNRELRVVLLKKKNSGHKPGVLGMMWHPWYLLYSDLMLKESEI